MTSPTPSPALFLVLSLVTFLAPCLSAFLWVQVVQQPLGAELLVVWKLPLALELLVALEMPLAV